MKTNGNLIEAITTEIHGVPFIGLAVYVEGRNVDIITKKPDPEFEGDAGFSVILESMAVHRISPIELLTDSEILYKQTVNVPGIFGRIVGEHELTLLYRQFLPGTRSYEALCDLYDLNKPEPEPQPAARIGWIGRIFNAIKQWLQTALTNMRGRFQ